jgi:pimeloyl-ACP methyl ester carboxylesterase
MLTDLFYEFHGNGPYLIFAHGLGGNHASWFNQVPFFARYFKVVTFDHRGFGNSRELGGGVDRSHFSADLAALISHLGAQRVVLVGQSMGGGTCVTFAALHPEKVSALILADTLVGITLPDSLKPQMESVRLATSGLPQLERVLSAEFREREPVLTHLYAELNSFNGGVRGSIRGHLPGVTPEQLYNTNIPILFLVGSHDILFPPCLVKKVHELIPNSQYREINNSGHSVYFEKSELFNEAVFGFLRDCGLVE